MLAIRNNMMADSAARSLGNSYNALSTSVERLSSGLRINSAKDDAAGLAVRELIRADIAALQQGSRNASDAVSMLQSAEGALGEVDSILIRMRELSEQASTGTYSATQKSIMQDEFDGLVDEITRITSTTDFNENNLLTAGSSVTVSLGSGLAAGKTIGISGQDMSAEGLGLTGKKEVATFDSGNALTGLSLTDNMFLGHTGAGSVDITFDGVTTNIVTASGADVTAQTVIDAINADHGETVAALNADGELELTAKTFGDKTDVSIAVTNAYWSGGTDVPAGSEATTVDGDTTSKIDITTGTLAVEQVTNAIATKDTFRAELGYTMNRLEYASSVLDVQAENLQAAESRISDVDIATEMASMTENKVLAQAGVSMLAQANQMPQMALKLIG